MPGSSLRIDRSGLLAGWGGEHRARARFAVEGPGCQARSHRTCVP